MSDKIKVAFVWQGINGRYSHWKDGLWAAMKILEKKYIVTYHEPHDDIPEDAIVLYWESPVTILGKDSENYKRIYNLPNKKILLFSGGPLKKEWVDKFDHVCVESLINVKECEELGIPHSVAFGINEDIFKPIKTEKKYDGIHHGTCASWKRQWLVGEALGDKAIVIGRYQESDPMPFDRCKELGVTVLGDMMQEELNKYLNQSYTCVQTSDYWGGGQRCTLEAMACGVPVICMEDSPKNREYVEESGFGEVVTPNKEEIKKAVDRIKEKNLDPQIGINYIKSKWTAKHYADSLIKAINTIL